MTASAPVQAPPILERDWTPHGWPGHVERFDAAEAPFYGSSVAEGICPDLHESDADQHDITPRRLVGGRGEDGTWLECEGCRALWRFRPPEAGEPEECTCPRCAGLLGRLRRPRGGRS